MISSLVSFLHEKSMNKIYTAGFTLTLYYSCFFDDTIAEYFGSNGILLWKEMQISSMSWKSHHHSTTGPTNQNFKGIHSNINILSIHWNNKIHLCKFIEKRTILDQVQASKIKKKQCGQLITINLGKSTLQFSDCWCSCFFNGTLLNFSLT